jgi:hypothetical protein
VILKEGDFKSDPIYLWAKELARSGEKVYVVAPHDVNTKNYEVWDENIHIYRFPCVFG